MKEIIANQKHIIGMFLGGILGVGILRLLYLWGYKLYEKLKDGDF